ncbi:MAG TPA: energy transducer TonB [Chthoniobacterales bacterium]|nr:energy transducer TonB [Chthoniobacterales bacterium]
MLRFWLALTAALLAAETLFAAEVQTKPAATPASSKPAASPATKPAASPSVRPAASPSASVAPAQLPQYRPALLGTGPTSVINRIDTAGLIRDGQKDGQLYFRCSVSKTGEIMDTWTYSQSPDSTKLERELVRCLDEAVFIPAVYDHEPVNVFFFGTVTFKVVDGKPRLRIFANQEAEELKKESDFIGPQPFVGRGSKFEGLHYPADTVTSELTGLVELGMKIDATGKLLDLKVVSEYPPLVGFRRAAAEDFRVATFIPAFREGKPVECNVTLPVYYEP